MKQKKNKFFTLLFSMMFGAGQMYMGFMKQGLSIMSCAIGIMAVGIITQLGIFYLLLPLIWFYGFFDSLNKSALADGDFMKLEDVSIFPFEINTQRIKVFTEKYRIYIGGGFIFMGICILNNNVLAYIFPQSSFILRVIGPQFFISIVIIAIGILLIAGKGQEFTDMWKFRKNTAQNVRRMQEEAKKSHTETIIDTVIAFDNNFFKEVKREEEQVSMEMFQPENTKNSNPEVSSDIETVK